MPPLDGDTIALETGPAGGLSPTGNITTTGNLLLGPTPRAATTGLIRVANGQVIIAARNAANSADIALFSLDSSDVLNLGPNVGIAASLGIGGGTRALTGYIRMPCAAGATQTLLATRDQGNANDLVALEIANNDTLWIGTDVNTTLAKQFVGISMYAQFSIGIGLGAQTRIYMQGTNIQIGRPTIGYAGASSPWGAVDGQVTIAVAAANITLSAAQYCTHGQKFTGAPAAQRNITYPLPATEEESYARIVWCQTTVSGIQVTNGGGLTVSIVANDTPHLLWFTPAGVHKIT